MIGLFCRAGASRRRLFCRAGLLGLLLAGGLSACNNQKPPAPPARFEQPNAVDFVCVINQQVTRLQNCSPFDRTNPFIKTPGKFDVAMHALVTQHSRGEVASVDLSEGKVIDSRRDIPGFTFVPVGQLPVAIVVPPQHPEFTYVAEFGSRAVRVLRTQALITPRNASEAEVQTVALMTTNGADGVPAAPTHMQLAPGEDALIVTAPDQGRVLWLPLVRCADYRDTNCDEYGLIDTDNIASIDLSGSASRIVPVAAPAKPQVPYGKLCGFEERVPAIAPDIVLAPDSLTPAPRPSGLAVDAFCIGDAPCTRRILVSDEALPLIHAIDIDAITPGSDGSDALLAPIVVGTATRGVAVTPHVPVAVGKDEDTQYVYAIDANDGSVLVTEHDRVINVNAAPSARPDRIELTDSLDVGTPPAAVALSVVTPVFRTDQPAGQYVSNTIAPNDPDVDPNLYCTDDESHPVEDPSRLRGVFLTIATADGIVRVVDVHDMELLDNDKPGSDGEADACRACPNLVRAPAVLRNHERLTSNFVTEEGEDAMTLTPSADAFAFVVGGLLYNVRPDGSSGSPDAPSLECIECDPNQSVVFPEPSEDIDETAIDADGGTEFGQDRCSGATPALLCANENPWTLSVDSWAATYEGAIPGANGSEAQFILPGDAANRTGLPEIGATIDFCAMGVLGDGDETIGDIEIAAAYTGDECGDDAEKPVGDQIEITSPLLGDVGLDALNADEATLKKCAEARDALKDDPKLAPRFAIRRSYTDRVVIGEGLLPAIGPLQTIDDLRLCLGDRPMNYVVRARDSFIVAPHLGSLPKNVKADSAGRCFVDPGADRLDRGRARLGCTFRNHAFTIRLRKPGRDDPVLEPPQGLSLAIRMATPAQKMISNLANLGFGGAASVVPVQMHYNAVDGYLYLVDIQDRGLVPIWLDPFPPGVDVAQTYF